MIGRGRFATAGLLVALGLVLAGAVSAQVRPDRGGPTAQPVAPVGVPTPKKPDLPARGGQICAVAYEDRNANGRRDGGEGPLAGQSFTIANAAGAQLAQGASGGDGRFCTPRPLPFGDYRVRLIPGGGLTNTDPGAASLNAKSVALRTEGAVTVLFGNCRGAGCAGGAGGEGRGAGGPGTPTPQALPHGRICVLKFNDLNNDKVKQANEPFLSGWNFKVTGPSGPFSGSTDANGSWCTPQFLLPGPYAVTETLKTGWVSTIPGGTTPTLSVSVSGNQTKFVYFGNRLAAPLPTTICATKFNDRNGDGIRQSTEPFLMGWKFTVSGSGGTVTLPLTGSSGTTCVEASLPGGSYTMMETNQEHWTPTTDGVHFFTLTPGQPVQYTFGNRQKPVLIFRKIVTSDALGGGFPSTGLISPNQFQVSYSCNVSATVSVPANGTASTLGYGGLSFGAVCSFAETPPPGPIFYSGCPSKKGRWDTPIITPPPALLGGENEVTITNRFVCDPPLPGTACVEKFEDLDGDGQRDAGEPPSAGWRFDLTMGLWGVTGADGRYCFTLPAGNYTVVETMQPDWGNSHPGLGNNLTKPFTVVSGQPVTIRFGNYRTAKLRFTKTVISTAPGGGFPTTGMPNGQFQFAHNCVLGYQAASGITGLSGGQTGPTAGIPGIPVGGVCTIVEAPLPSGNVNFDACASGAGRWETPIIATTPVTIVPGMNTVTVTNRFVCTAPLAPGKVCVTKYNDLNGDGARQSTEPWLAGWNFTVKNANNVTVTTLTSADGYPACSPFILPPGNYTIAEVLPATGWLNTDPGGAAIEPFTVSAGGTFNAVFGNFRLGRICVRKYNDVNGNGAWYGGSSGTEPFITGVPFEVRDSSGQVVHTGLTAALGQYCTPSTLMPGVYTVTEIVPGGWTNTQPGGAASVSVTIPTPYGGPTDFWFGNHKNPQPGELCVDKYNDLNGDGDQDPGEGPLQGWGFTRSGGGMPSLSGSTSADGRWCPGTELPPGTYTVTETTKTGWTNTDPVGAPVKTALVVTNQTTIVKFGNQQDPLPGEICVRKYKDVNNNGAFDIGEPPLSGWQFTVRDASNTIVSVGSTDGDGEWCTPTLIPPGTYTVTETPQTGWTNTDPGNSTLTKTVVVGSNAAPTVWFGNRQP